MNKHTISENTMYDFLCNYTQLMKYLADCHQEIVKAKFHLGYYSYTAKIWSKHNNDTPTKGETK